MTTALYTPIRGSGVISNTPSGTVYGFSPGQTVAAQVADVALLESFGFTAVSASGGLDPIAAQDFLANGDTVSAAPTATSIGTGFTIVSGTLVSLFNPVGANGITVSAVSNTATFELSTQTDARLIGNYNGTVGGPVTIGSGIALSAGGALTATGSGGSVTSVVAVAGPFLNASTINSTGSINNSSTSLTLHGVLLGQGAGAVVATGTLADGQLLIGVNGIDPVPRSVSGDITINSGGTAALGSIVAGGTFGSSALVPVIVVDTKGRITNITTAAVTGAAAAGGVAINSGTVSINNKMTLTGTAGGTITIAPASGTSDVIVNLAASGGTQTVAGTPSFVRQRAEIDFVHGATASIVNLNSNFVYGTSGPTSFTAGTIANAIDRVMLMSPDGTKWAVMAVNTGFVV